MRQITKEIQVYIDGSPLGFRLTKPDAFSGVPLLRLRPRNLPVRRRAPFPAGGRRDVEAARVPGRNLYPGRPAGHHRADPGPQGE